MIVVLGGDDAEEGESICVIFKIDDELAGQFPQPTKPDGSKSTMPPHCTLLYTKLEKSDKKLARKLIRKVASTTKPFQVRLGGKGTFPNCVWVPVKGPGPNSLHERLLETLRSHGIEAEQKHDEFVGHATVEYTEDPENWKGPLPRGSFWVRSIEVWFGEAKRRSASYKLGSRLRSRSKQ